MHTTNTRMPRHPSQCLTSTATAETPLVAFVANNRMSAKLGATVAKFANGPAFAILTALLVTLGNPQSARSAGFDFGGGGGGTKSGSFNGYVGNNVHQTVGSTTAESTIPAGISNFSVTLTANTDVDVELWDGNTMVVGWNGLIDSDHQVTGSYGGNTITWSGYNGIGGNPGRESITIAGTINRSFVMKVFGYQAGSYTVSYAWGQSNPQPPTASVKKQLIDATMQTYQADNGQRRGQCKAYLQGVFRTTAITLGITNPNGSTPIMPANVSGYYWAIDANSGFLKITQVLPSGSDQSRLDSAKGLLMQVKKGDYVQYGTLQSTSEKLHTLCITADYVSGQPIQWADSNWLNDEVVNAYQQKSLDALADLISRKTTLSSGSTYSKGATLYRIRDDLKK